jgi:ribonuclease HII
VIELSTMLYYANCYLPALSPLTRINTCLFTEIDRINILQASLLAMKIAIEDVLKINIKNSGDDDQWYALIDGSKCPNKLTIKSKPFIRGDSLVYPIALASIVAKVERDHLMVSNTLITTYKPNKPICKKYNRLPFQKIDILFCF